MQHDNIQNLITIPWLNKLDYISSDIQDLDRSYKKSFNREHVTPAIHMKGQNTQKNYTEILRIKPIPTCECIKK